MSGAEVIAVVGVLAAAVQLTIYGFKAGSVLSDRLGVSTKGSAVLDQILNKANNLYEYIQAVETQYIANPEILCTLKECATEARLLMDCTRQVRSISQADRKRGLMARFNLTVLQEPAEARIAKHLKHIRHFEMDLIFFINVKSHTDLLKIGDDVAMVGETVQRVETSLDYNFAIVQKQMKRNIATLEKLFNDRFGRVEEMVENLSLLHLDLRNRSADCNFQTATVLPQPESTKMKNRCSMYTHMYSNEPFFGYVPQLHKLARVSRQGRAAVVGLPGVGKTRLIEEFVSGLKLMNSKSTSFWVNGTTEETFKQGFHQILLDDFTTVSGSLVDTPEIRDEEQYKANLPPQILIIDGIYRTNLTCDEKRLVESLNPSSSRMMVISATNNTVIQNIVPTDAVVWLSALDARNSQQLFLQRLDAKFERPQTSLQIASMLSHHPLAICQVASSLRATGFNMDDCLHRSRGFEFVEDALLQHNIVSPNSGNMPTTCVKSFWIAFKYIGKIDAFAIEVLKRMSCFHMIDVTAKLLPSGTSTLHLPKALDLLESAFMVTQRGRRGSYNLHPLVRLAIRSQLQSTGRLHQYLDMALSKILDHFPIVSGDDSPVDALETSLLSHARSVLEEQPLRASAQSRTKLSRLTVGVAIAYKQRGKFGLALELIEQALELSRQDDDDVFGLTARHHQAINLRRLGRSKEAEHVALAVHRERKEKLGQWHQDTLASLNNLGMIYHSEAKFDLAEKTIQAALDGKAKAPGQDQRRIMISMINLGEVMRSSGKCDEAERIFAKVVQWRKEHLGERDLATLSAISHLATAFQEQKKWEDAWETHNEAFNGRLLILGRNHPSTIRSQANLAYILQSQGFYSQAEDLLKEVHKMCVDAKGEKTPSMVSVVSNIASLMQDQKRYHEAATMSQKALSLSRKILGRENPETKACKEQFDELRSFHIKRDLGDKAREAWGQRKAMDNND